MAYHARELRWGELRFGFGDSTVWVLKRMDMVGLVDRDTCDGDHTTAAFNWVGASSSVYFNGIPARQIRPHKFGYNLLL